MNNEKTTVEATNNETTNSAKETEKMTGAELYIKLLLGI